MDDAQPLPVFLFHGSASERSFRRLAVKGVARLPVLSGAEV
ncbi:hypothetical protein [Sphingomonas sp. Sph1(2015)]|jgi:hypothetical protein|nr:hypothetical protein [Sphingomonas sp. Sph1(2015)]